MRLTMNKETPGEDPYLTGEYAMQYIRGMQYLLRSAKICHKDPSMCPCLFLVGLCP